MKRAAFVLAGVLAGPAWLSAQTSVDQKRPAAPEGSVKIENMLGSVKVTGWDRAEVQVKGTVGDGGELAFDGSDKRTRVEVEAEHGNPMGVKSDLEIFVPAGSAVDIEGFQATIVVAGVTGSVKAETVNGSITHTGAARSVELQSVNGAIDLAKAAGRVKAEAVNGAVTVRDASGELEASTVNGKLLVTGGSFDRAALETVSGAARFEGVLAARATLSVESVSGSVDLLLPASLGADFSVSTFSGEITNELGPAAEKASRWTPEKELSFTTGSGGARITVKTLSGAVHIRKRQ
ncbi:MAG TPA: DUF4097 family beta strand repeat-containing protein [Vicinamibacteria bacterium]|nr:DUF4097 family beta strand repeat-containing protein [Vicinamibacteria bacterium]